MAVSLRCPICRDKFRWDTANGWPRFCACCGADISAPEGDVITLPGILTRNSKVPDQVARQIMDGSEQRVHMAAELAGTTASEMASLKITNLNDRNDAQQAAIMPRNEVSQWMAQNPQAPVGHRADGAQYSTAVQTGPGANMGAQMMSRVNSRHAQISRGSAVSDRPALETQQPGYRKRG